MTSPTQTNNKSSRLVEVDALRGIAAVLVMLFHFTTRYDEIYHHTSSPFFSLPWGHYGVNLFFMISGFVIFMTLHKVRHPMDFVVSRFSRLFPAFWVAVILTFLLTHALALPDKTVDLATAGMNLFMLHGLFKIPNVDGVYWTLEVELLFYFMAFMLYRVKRLDRVHTVLLILIGLRLSYFVADKLAGIELSWTLSRLLILPYIAWFALGIMIYRQATLPNVTPIKDRLVTLAAFTQLGIVEGVGIALLAVFFSVLLWTAANQRLHLLKNPLLMWLGAISYTLYLLHENIGWGVIRLTEQSGISPNLAILVAICIALALATALTQFIERPAMGWLRARYKRSTMPSITNTALAVLAGIFFTAFAGLAYAWHKTTPARSPIVNSLNNIFVPAPADATPCNLNALPARPLMLLVLGQSNAGNHGAPSSQHGPSTTFFFKGNCYKTAGPAPGATGRGSNIWTTLGPIVEERAGHPFVFSVLAVDATRIRDWVRQGPLRDRLMETIAIQKLSGFIPDAILWQQGEADARAGATRQDYQRDFEQLVAFLRNTGITAPILAALSTRCRNEGSTEVRLALKDIAERNKTVHIGPNLDSLTGNYRYDGCHFSDIGTKNAAVLWATSISALPDLDVR